MGKTAAVRLILLCFLALVASGCQNAGPGDANPPVAKPPAKPAACDGENINTKLTGQVNPDANTKVRIAPMKKQGETGAGDFTDVDGGIFDAIFKRIGITPCDTDPKDLRGTDGFLEFEENSSVLNKGATRATFGYFIKATVGGQEVEYFALFSYDKITVKKDGKEVVVCATEFFLFGPFKRKADGSIDPDPAALLFGLAIDKNGCLLPEVPLDLAKVKNFLDDHLATEPVRPGVAKDGEGCLVCHGRNDQFPQSTAPFPWVKKP
jgi:hypothetical protein